MKKKNTSAPVTSIDPFVNWSHTTGRIFMLCFLAYTFVIPITMSVVYGVWPTMSQLIPGVLAISALMIPTSIAEVASYVPIVGSSAYLCYATGNLMNLKIPCAVEAQKVAKVEQNTPEGDAIALISTSISSIVTIVILAIGMLLLMPLQGLMQNEYVQTAGNYILPALFGSMAMGIVGRGNAPTYVKNKLTIAIVPVILVVVLSLIGLPVLDMAVYLILPMIPIAIGCARILWKKGIVKVVPNPDYQGSGQK